MYSPLDGWGVQEVVVSACGVGDYSSCSCCALFQVTVRLCSSEPSLAVSEDDLSRLATVQVQVVLFGPFLHIVEFHEARRHVAGRDDDIDRFKIVEVTFKGHRRSYRPTPCSGTVGFEQLKCHEGQPRASIKNIFLVNVQ